MIFGLLVTLIISSYSVNLNAQEGKKETEEITCGAENLKDCYDQAVQAYKDRDYEQCKALFEKVVTVDAHYKKTAKYLKKCQAKIAEKKIQEQAEAQRLAREEQKKQEEEDRLRQEELLREQQLLEEQKKEAERLKQLEEQPLPAEETEKAAAVEEPPQEAAKPQAITYRIGVGDVLEISVWRNPDLDKNVIVRPDGVISYPLVGDIPAVGLSLTELDDRLTEALRDYVRNPVVSVAITRFGGTKVIVLGEVRAPGIYSPPGGGSVIDAIALAGGFTEHAVKRGAFLVRGTLQNPEVYRLNLARVFKGDLSQNLAVQSNDIIYVPKRFIANLNYVIQQITPTLQATLLGTSVAESLQRLK